MIKHLVIVESPAKAKTIEKFLGNNYKVLSSIGHIRTIAKKGKDGEDAINITKGFETTYEIDPEKKRIITDLRKAVKNADEILLATDEDREGEAIAWHLCEVLKLDPTKTKRIVFHEITKSAIEEAIKNPRTINMDLVRAQQARQILDRIVGFDLSDVVRRKVPGGISAGRVQSPGVRLLVEREREIDEFKSSYKFRVSAEFEINNVVFSAILSKYFETEEEANSFLNSIKDARFSISDISKSPSTRNPSAPFTTSTLQQEANSRLGFGAKVTMSAAQRLYQDGKITYMRTDSVNLSNQALTQILNFLRSSFGENYCQIRKYKTKSASAQEAHEAIRPTDIHLENASSNTVDQKLYELIRKRALASQMASAKLEKTEVIIAIHNNHNVDNGDINFIAKGETIVFDGFLKIYDKAKNESGILPAFMKGDLVSLRTALAKQTHTKPPARYTEGSLVKKLEELGIGRPSTYATIINTLQVREYATKGESEGVDRDSILLKLDTNIGQITREIIQERAGSDKGKLIPTASGIIISDFLGNYFSPIVDYSFTANVEKEFDEIASGKLDRNKMLREFYDPFHNLIKKSGEIERNAVAKARKVGTDPKSGLPIYARFGRYGPLLQLGDTDDSSQKPRFAPLPPGTKIESITLTQATKALELPRKVGNTVDGQEIIANVGRFGPYIQVGNMFVSIKKPLDPHTITLDEARKIYLEKLADKTSKKIIDFENGITVLNGRYGPYVTNGKKNARIPKDLNPTKITLDQAKELLDSRPKAKKFVQRGHRRPSK